MPLDNRGREHAHAFSLALAGEGERVRIVALAGGKGVERRLIDLGLPVGTDLEVIHRQGPGRMVVGRAYARVALGAGITRKILVSLPEDRKDSGVSPRAAAE